ncbi:unnamed protein product [Lymnaea stagnalis]|uniref:COX assembly mitochondrial protein n=1 Tax=Lymnaea stagnalis TaxID=6523 RepID=A0AAV2HA40_LYMST
MHPDLSPHLHTEECNEVIAALKKCHKDNPFKKIFGACNELDQAMTKCLKQERELKRQMNKNKSPQRGQLSSPPS